MDPKTRVSYQHFPPQSEIHPRHSRESITLSSAFSSQPQQSSPSPSDEPISTTRPSTAQVIDASEIHPDSPIVIVSSSHLHVPRSHAASSYSVSVIQHSLFRQEDIDRAELRDLSLLYYLLQFQLLWQPSLTSRLSHLSRASVQSFTSKTIKPTSQRLFKYQIRLLSAAIFTAGLFVWFPFVLMFINFLPVSYKPSTFGKFATIYGVIFTMSIAAHQNLSLLYLKSGHLEEVIASVRKQDLPYIRWTMQQYTCITFMTYIIPRITWSPLQPYYTLLFQGASPSVQVINTISRIYGDMAVLTMCIVLSVVSAVLRRKIYLFKSQLKKYEVLDVWELIEIHKRDVASHIQRFSNLVEKWLMLHVLLFLMSVFYNALDVYLAFIGSMDAIPVVCMVKDLSLFIFVLAVPFLLVSSITRDCDLLIVHLATTSKNNLPTLLQNRSELSHLLQYMIAAQTGFRLFNVRITMSMTRYSWLLSVGSMLLTAVHYSQIPID